MDFEIIDSEKIIISNGNEVCLYDEFGKQLFVEIPSQKVFIEMAYIHSPVSFSSESFEMAIKFYLELREDTETHIIERHNN